LPTPSDPIPSLLLPGQQAQSSAIYLITQPDIDAGFVDNQVIVTGTGPLGEVTEDLSDTGNVDDVNETGGPDDPTNTPLEESPCIELTKSSIFDIGGDGVPNAGDQILYFYVITNCGNVTLNNVDLVELQSNFTGTGDLPVPSMPTLSSLIPGQSISASATYFVTQTDIDRGFVDNQAFASANDPQGNTIDDLSDTRNLNDINETGGPDDPTNTPLQAHPCIELLKSSSLEMGADGIPTVGDIVTYSYTITNCGNVTIDEISINEDDLLFSGTGILPIPETLPETVLQPGEFTTTTSDYALTQEDIDAGFINNQAFTVGSSPSGEPVDDLSDTANENDPNETGGADDPTNTSIDQIPCISLTKGSFLDFGFDQMTTPE